MRFLSMRRRRYPCVASALILTLVFPHAAAAQQAPALPQGGQVVHGGATIAAPHGAALQIDQSTARAIINWSDFSIGEGGLVNITQPGAAAALLNRVTGGNASAILGQLKANGQVYLINPQGIVVGPNGTIDTAAFVGSTLNTSDEAFLGAGAMRFAGESSGAVINVGTIRASGGDVVIIAPRIANQGSIAAPAGTAALLSGQEVIYAPASSAILIKAPSQVGTGAAIDNAGAIQAAEVQLRAAGSAHALAVNNGGVISATSISNRGGRIVLDGGEGRTVSSGSLTATGTAGGSIDVLGNSVELTAGVLDASGVTGGGQIRVGGGWQGKDESVRNAERTSVAAGVTQRANAIESGHGGTIVNWADGHTEFRGAIEAKGGAAGGNGGNAEVSGKATLAYDGRADLRSPHGTTGTLLLDPGTLNIDGAQAATIVNDLNSANVNLLAYDDINVNAAISNSSTTNTLTLEGNNIAVNANITLPQGTVEFGVYNNNYNSLTSTSGASISADLIRVAGSFSSANLAGPLLTPNNGLSFNPQAGTTPGSFTATNASNQIKNLYLTSGSVTVNGNVDIRSSVAMQVANKLVVSGNLTFVSGGNLAFAGGSPTLTVSGVTRLASTGGVFNNNGSLVLNGAGRKLIYSKFTNGAYNVSGHAFTVRDGVSFDDDPIGSGNVIYTGTTSTLPVMTITADSKTMEYGGFTPTYTASFSGGTAADLTSPVLFQIGGAHSNVGTYTITPYGAASSAYALSYVSGTLTVTPAPLMITAPNASMTYGSQVPAFTPVYNGFRNGDGPSVISGLQISTTATSRSGVGTYPIVLSGGSAQNYTLTLANGTLRITPAILTIRVNDASRLFGSPNPLFSTTVSGLLNGDTLPPLTDLNFSTSAGERSPVGQYGVGATSGISMANYDIRFVPGTLTVTPAPLTVSTTSAAAVYGQPIPTLITTVVGLVAGDTNASLGISHSTGVRQGTGVGIYPTTLSGNFGNYAVAYTPGTISISPAPLRISADDFRRTQFEANPQFTAKIEGLYGDDQVGRLELKTSADLTSPAGRYAIIPTAAADPNYFMIFESGTLTVDQPPPTLIVTGLEQDFTNLTIPDFIPTTTNDVRVSSNSTGLDGLLVNARPVVLDALAPLGDASKYLYLLGRSEMPGDHSELGKVLPFLLAKADTILKKTGPWTAEETAFIEHLTSTISAQRQAAAEQAQAGVEAWKRERQAENEKQGVISTISVAGVPPKSFLEQAQAGVALDGDSAGAFAATLAAAASLDSEDGTTGAIVAGTVAATVVAGAAATVGAVALTVGIEVGAVVGSSGATMVVGNAAGWSAAAGAASAGAVVAVVALMAAAAIKTGIEVANMGEYERDLAAAVAAAQRPTTVDDLRAMLATADGQQRAFYYLTADLANNTTTGSK